MGKRKFFVNKLHHSSKRNYLKRMNNQKVKGMQIASKYGYDYWDGNRRYGYGGYKYIPGRWTSVAKKLIKNYSLNNNSHILDVGCGKAYLLYEIKLLLPKIKIYGFDISSYAIKKSKNIVRKNLFVHNAKNKFPYKDKKFDLVISLATLHNLSINELFSCIKEIERVAKKKYIMVESYNNFQELFNLQCWALTCKSFYSINDWNWIFKTNKYKGDFEFISFK